MTSQVRPQDLVLAAAGSGESVAALQALRWAMSWTTATLAACGPDDTPALELVIALDDALGELPGLAGAADDVLRRAFPGPDVGAHLADRLAALAAVRERTASARLRLDEVSAAERELRRLAQEHEEIQARLAELSVLERKVAAIPELTESERTLARRAEAMRARTAAAEEALAATAEEVIGLGEERMADLGGRVRELLERIRTSETAYTAELHRHDEAIVELREAVRRYDGLQEFRDDIAALAVYADVDRELSHALTDAIGRDVTVDGTGVRDVVTALRSGLGRIDAALARAVAEHQKLESVARRVLRFGEAGPGEP